MVSIASTLVSNSTQLDNIDLQSGPRDFTITGAVLTEGAEQPLSITLAEYPRPWKPGLTVRRVLFGLWGEETDDWIGHRVRLFRDEKVSFGRDKTGGTRISHASHIASRLTLTLPISKGKFGEFTVQPLPDAPAAKAPTPEPIESRVKKAVDWFGAKGVQQSVLEAHVGSSVDEWTDADLESLTAARDELVGGGSE